MAAFAKVAKLVGETVSTGVKNTGKQASKLASKPTTVGKTVATTAGGLTFGGLAGGLIGTANAKKGDVYNFNIEGEGSPEQASMIDKLMQGINGENSKGDTTNYLPWILAGLGIIILVIVLGKQKRGKR